MEATIWYLICGVVIVALVAAFWRRVVRAVLLLAGLGVAGLIAWAFAAQATATQQVATVATVSAAGSTAGNVAGALLGLLLLGAVGYIVVLRWQLRPAAGAGRGTWTSGPNALWGRDEARLAGGAPAVDAGQALGMLVQLETLRMLRELRQPVMMQAALPEYADEYDPGDGPAWW